MKGADVVSASRLASIAAENAVSPKEAHLIELEKKGYGRMRRKFKPDGSYTYDFSFRPNNGHGKLTHAAEAVRELMTPRWRVGAKRAAEHRPQAQVPAPFRGTGGIFARGLTAKEAECFCERCERRKWACECPSH